MKTPASQSGICPALCSPSREQHPSFTNYLSSLTPPSSLLLPAKLIGVLSILLPTLLLGHPTSRHCSHHLHSPSTMFPPFRDCNEPLTVCFSHSPLLLSNMFFTSAERPFFREHAYGLLVPCLKPSIASQCF